MKEIRRIECAGVIFLDDKGKILLEDRRKIKKHGEHWSFFGGSMEKGETKEQTLKREIKEEMNYNIKKYLFFKKYQHMPIKTLHLTYYMYIAKCPQLREISVHSGAAAKLFTIRQALRLKITKIDKQIIREVQKYLKNQPNIDLNLS